MKLLKTIPVSAGKKKYEIRILFENNTIHILAFHENRPANGFRHQLKIRKTTDPETILDSDEVRHLVDLTKDEVIVKKEEQSEV